MQRRGVPTVRPGADRRWSLSAAMSGVRALGAGVHSVRVGTAKAYLIESDDGLIAVDCGTPEAASAILAAARSLGREPAAIRHILVTHCHPDHAGGLASLKEASGAVAYMHPADAALVRRGEGLRPLRPAPGLLNRVLYEVFISGAMSQVPPAVVEHEVNGGDVVPIAGGIHAIHTPGHTAGHLCFLLPRKGGIFFAGDVAGNVLRLGLSLAYEDVALGLESLRRVSSLEFDAACFGHGGAILGGAAERFRLRWPPRAGHPEPAPSTT